VADIVNFAHGAFIVVGMATTAIAANNYGIDPMFMIPVNAVLLFVLGYGTYKILIKRVMDAPMESQIYVTFGLFVFISFSLLIVLGPSVFDVETFVFEGTTEVGGIFISHPRVVTGVVCILTLGLLFGFLQRTRTGKAIRATAQDREVARVMGIDTHRTLAITWGLGTATVGVAGTLIITFTPAHPETSPIAWTLLAFAAVALGGFGNILAAAFGGLGVAFVEQFASRLLDPSYNQVYIFSVFFVALLVRQIYADRKA
jgi:branched-chain amino acid transport system permease protein